METNGQLHTPAALLPGKEPPAPAGGWWAPEPVWTRWWRKNSRPLPGRVSPLSNFCFCHLMPSVHRDLATGQFPFQVFVLSCSDLGTKRSYDGPNPRTYTTAYKIPIFRIYSQSDNTANDSQRRRRRSDCDKVRALQGTPPHSTSLTLRVTSWASAVIASEDVAEGEALQ